MPQSRKAVKQVAWTCFTGFSCSRWGSCGVLFQQWAIIVGVLLDVLATTTFPGLQLFFLTPLSPTQDPCEFLSHLLILQSSLRVCLILITAQHLALAVSCRHVLVATYSKLQAKWLVLSHTHPQTHNVRPGVPVCSQGWINSCHLE